MSNRILTPMERASVEELRGNTRVKEAYMKLSVLFMLDKGKSYEEISVILDLSLSLISNCRKEFEEGELDKYLNKYYLPYQGKLDECQLSSLDQRVSSGIYTTSGEVQAYIERESG